MSLYSDEVIEKPGKDMGDYGWYRGQGSSQVLV
jgi:hypothetical protein